MTAKSKKKQTYILNWNSWQYEEITTSKMRQQQFKSTSHMANKQELGYIWITMLLLIKLKIFSFLNSMKKIFAFLDWLSTVKKQIILFYQSAISFIKQLKLLRFQTYF